MTANDIRAGVAALRPWFHQIDLGHGIFTKAASAASEPVDHPNPTWQIVKQALPADLTGKSVLDVGCNAGFYAFEAKRRGAARVLGVDAQSLPVRQGLFARDALGLDVDFQRMSVYDLSPAAVGQFDVTLALGLLYHCKHIILAMERLFQVTKDLLIVESAILPQEKAFEPFTQVLGGPTRQFNALAYIANDPQAKEAVFNWFVPTVSALEAMLRDVGFRSVSTISVGQGRAVMACRHPAPVDSFSMPHLLTSALRFEEGPAQCACSRPVEFRIAAENTGQAVWLARGKGNGDKGAVRLGVHLFDQNHREISWDYARVALSRDVEPGSAATVTLTMSAPAAPGKYHVAFDMVSECLTWFEDNGCVPLVRELEVLSRS